MYRKLEELCMKLAYYDEILSKGCQLSFEEEMKYREIEKHIENLEKYRG